MAFSSKYFYIRAIFFLPVSIGLLVAGIKGLSVNLNDYTRYEGVVEKMDYTKVMLNLSMILIVFRHFLKAKNPIQDLHDYRY